MSGGVHAVTVAPPLLLWAASLYKLPALSRGESQPALSAYWSAIDWLAVAMTLLVPPLAAGLDQVLHVPNVAWLLMYAAVLLSGFSATIALLHEAPGPDTGRAERARRYACAGSIAALVLLFAVARPSVETDDFVMTYGDEPVVAAFLTIFYGALAFVCVDMAPRCWRAADNVTGLLRLGLRGSSVAAGLALVYIAYNETVVVQLVSGNAAAIVGDPLALSRAILAETAAGFTEAELARAKAQARSALLMGLESVQARADHLARSLEVRGRIVDAAESVAEIDAVTVDQVRRVARAALANPSALATVGGKLALAA